MILKFLQPFHGVNNIPKIIFFTFPFSTWTYRLEITMKDTESTDLIYQLESKSFFLYLAGRKKEFQQLLYVDYFLSLLKRIFMGTGNGLLKNY